MMWLTFKICSFGIVLLGSVASSDIDLGPTFPRENPQLTFDLSTKMYVFVYGTLKSGEPNHHWLTTASHGNARFVSTGTMATKYPLVIASRYNVPFLLDVPGTGQEVEGEVYDVDEEMLKNLDMLEEHPNVYHRREEVIRLHIPQGQGQGQVSAWTYLFYKFGQHTLDLPHLKSYSSAGPHNLPYVASEDMARDPDDPNDAYDV